jgi:hypothetical protein
MAKNTRLRQHPACSPILEVRHMPIFSVSAMPSSPYDFVEIRIRFFNPHAMLFDLGGTAKRRNLT